MKKCKSCKSEIDETATKCPHCQTDQRSWFRRHPILTGILGFFLFIIVIGVTGSGDTDKTPAVSDNTSDQIENEAVAHQKEEPKDPNPNFKDGTHRVGEDIQPGTYRTREGSSGCYYARLSGFGGSLDEIISNENTSYPAIVTIAETDEGFKSTNCGTWTQDLSAITESQTTFTDGMYIVGTDIEPGTYKSTGQTGCYYARLSGFSGGLGEIISNENTDEPAVVTIAATDEGFKSSGCGIWEKIE